MLKNILKLLLSAALIVSVMSVAVSAAPFKEHKIGEGETVIAAVDFDTVDYSESNPDGGNHDIRFEEEIQTYDYTINNDYAGGRETDTPSCIGWVAADEWVQYTVDVVTAGKYQVATWLATDQNEGDFNVYADGSLIGAAVCESIGWHTYVSYNIGTVDLTTGTHVIKAEWTAGGPNFESLVFTLIEAAPVIVEEVEAPAAVPEAAVEAPADPISEPAPTVPTAPVTGDNTAVLAIAIIAALSVVVVVAKKRKTTI
jgi:uncharacterized protein involved in high-affinity Fe2+ transport